MSNTSDNLNCKRIAIVGAGLSATIYAGRAGVETVVLGCAPNIAGEYEIDNYFGYEQTITGRELMERGVRRAERQLNAIFSRHHELNSPNAMKCLSLAKTLFPYGFKRLCPVTAQFSSRLFIRINIGRKRTKVFAVCAGVATSLPYLLKGQSFCHA